MATSRNTGRTVWMLGASVLVAVSGTAMAQDSGESTLLKGPEVVENSGPGAGSTMSGEAKKERTGELRFMSYIRALRAMEKASEENPELALTEEQDAQIREIGKAHRDAMRAFMDEHKEEFEALRPARGERGERGERGARRGPGGERGGFGDPEGDPMMEEAPARGPRGERGDGAERPSPEEMQARREALAKLMDQAPSDEDAKKAMWDVLNESQREFVTKDVMRQREARQKRVDEAMNGEKRGEAASGEGKKRGERLQRRRSGSSDD